MEKKMTEIRRTDSNALFVVYAGIAHFSWLGAVSLPKFFAQEKPVVIELALNEYLRETSLSNVWPAEDSFFTQPPQKTNFFFWSGDEARDLARNVGFDYLLVVPTTY